MLHSVAQADEKTLPGGFVFLFEIDPSIIENVRYYGEENFLGMRVPGYTVNRIICTEKAALALKKVNESLNKKGYKLVVYDGYRPQRAADAFGEWGENDDDSMKAYYYPTITKEDIFKFGFVAKRSEHTRGSTFDLTMIEKNKKLKNIQVSERTLKNGEKIPFLDDNTVDMGSSFDLFHDVSHQNSDLITEKEKQNRQLLRDEMSKAGFKGYTEEWWHYRLIDEPFPDTYFNFVL